MAGTDEDETDAVAATHPSAKLGPFPLRAAIIVLAGVAAVGVVLCLPPIRQSQSYHDLADTRVVGGIPRFGDVITHIPYLVVGLLGLSWVLSRRGGRGGGAFIQPVEALNYGVFFFGFTLTAFGSAWYHLNPCDETLFWDRLPMSVTFMGLFASMIADRISVRAGVYLLPVLVAVGIASVVYWHLGGRSGDLKFYFGLVQVYPMTAIVLMLVFFAPRYSHGGYLLWMFGLYGLAVICEGLDWPIFEASGGLVSGHNLKHLLAATGVLCVLLMLRHRRPMAGPRGRY